MNGVTVTKWNAFASSGENFSKSLHSSLLIKKSNIMVCWFCLSGNLGCEFGGDFFFPEILTAFHLHLCCALGEKMMLLGKKKELSLLEFYNSNITIHILCSCKSNPFISMASSTGLKRPTLSLRFVMNWRISLLSAAGSGCSYIRALMSL